MKLSVCAGRPELFNICTLLRNAISLVVAVLMLVARAYFARLAALGHL